MHATEMKTKRHYTSPVTRRATVELEGGFCGSIIDSSAKTVNITSSAQEYEEIADTYSWDTDGNQTGGMSTISWD